MSDLRTPVDVAVGVLLRPDGQFLLASRPEGKPYAGYWEFPGGKVEPGESVAAALTRELHEELGLDLGTIVPWVVRVFDYPHARVRLHFCRVFDWRGMPQAREGQRWQFSSLAQLPDGPLLPATVPVLRWLDLPMIYAVSDAARVGPGEFLRRLAAQLADGLRLLQWREIEPLNEDAESTFHQACDLAHQAGASLLVSSRHPSAWRAFADGVHLTASELSRCTERPAGSLVAASIHTRAELDRAIALECDFAVAGSVCPTTTHPDGLTLGWDGLQALIAGSAIPVYAIGGLARSDLKRAQSLGAHGVALRSAAWPAV